jgi:hypothetical protein
VIRSDGEIDIALDTILMMLMRYNEGVVLLIPWRLTLLPMP